MKGNASLGALQVALSLCLGTVRHPCSFAEHARLPRAVLFLKYDGVSTLCAVGNAHGMRAELTTLMVALALDTAAREGRSMPAFSLIFNLNDHSCTGDLVYAASTRCRPSAAPPLLAPDYTLVSWVYAGVDSFSRAVPEFARSGRQPPSLRVCGWAGSVANHPVRRRFVRAARVHGDSLEAYAGPRLDQPAQARRWACAVDLPAIGYSGRLPLLLHSGRPVLLVDRVMRTWYRDPAHNGALTPWEHYIPVDSGLLHLVPRAQTVLAGSNGTAHIGRRAQAFARRVLTLRTAVRFLMFQLLARAGGPTPAPAQRLVEAAAAGTGTEAITAVEHMSFAELLVAFPALFPTHGRDVGRCTPARASRGSNP